MIHTLVDACRFILEDQAEAQSRTWVASHVAEMRLWRASESGVLHARNYDVEEHGETSLFMKVGEDEYAFRSWTAGRFDGSRFHNEEVSPKDSGRMAAGDPARHHGRP
jgi:hypothetical protein